MAKKIVDLVSETIQNWRSHEESVGKSIAEQATIIAEAQQAKSTKP